LLPRFSAFITSQQFDVEPPMKTFDWSVPTLEPILATLERNHKIFELYTTLDKIAKLLKSIVRNGRSTTSNVFNVFPKVFDNVFKKIGSSKKFPFELSKEAKLEPNTLELHSATSADIVASSAIKRNTFRLPGCVDFCRSLFRKYMFYTMNKEKRLLTIDLYPLSTAHGTCCYPLLPTTKPCCTLVVQVWNTSTKWLYVEISVRCTDFHLQGYKGSKNVVLFECV
jgi:hypothetical protein